MHSLIHRVLIVPLVIACSALPLHSAEPARWEPIKVEETEDWKVGLSQPVLVARSKGHLWFPTIMSLANGELLAMLNNYADEVVHQPTAVVCWSKDGGLSWSEPKAELYGDSNFRLANGDQLILPYNLYPGADSKTLIGPYQVCPKGEHALRVVKEGLVVSGLPRPDRPDPKRKVSGFVFNGGGVRLKDGGYLATLYGHFADTKRCSLIVAASSDGVRWQVRSVVADETCPLPGPDGPTEAATCRLKDGRLMCIFRLGSGQRYGQAFSSDEGKTWTEPVATPPEVFSVQPCLLVRNDGAVVLSGGRPGIFLWINTAGDGKSWQRVDLLQHHNACRPTETIGKVSTDEHSRTTAYTRIVALSDDKLLHIYDRAPNGWRALPKDSTETNSVWVMQVTLERKKK